jgi:DNA-binding MurR/RpiR family transcriptional regulator
VAIKKASSVQQTVPGDVIEDLRRSYDRLTQSQKRIAEYIVENSEAVAFSTVDQMAAQLEINPSTIVRFAYRLGLNGFPDLQERIRQLVRGQLSRASDPGSSDEIGGHLRGTCFEASLSHDLKNLQRTIAALSAEDLQKAVDLLVSARRVFVGAGFTSHSLAYYFGYIFNRLRSDVLVVGGDNLSMTPLVEMSAEDCLVVFTFPRYAASTLRLASWAKENGTSILAITDSPISSVGQIADIVILAGASGSAIDNSLVAPMAVVNALVDGVAAASGPLALDRLARRERLMQRWDAFLLRPDAPTEE